MRREFLCHRCGRVNRRGAENCVHCGLQLAWRPSFPDSLRFWRWPVLLKEFVGSLAAPLAATVVLTFSGTWAAYWVSLPLLALSALTLFSHFLNQVPSAGNPE